MQTRQEVTKNTDDKIEKKATINDLLEKYNLQLISETIQKGFSNVKVQTSEIDNCTLPEFCNYMRTLKNQSGHFIMLSRLDENSDAFKDKDILVKKLYLQDIQALLPLLQEKFYNVFFHKIKKIYEEYGCYANITVAAANLRQQYERITNTALREKRIAEANNQLNPLIQNIFSDTKKGLEGVLHLIDTLILPKEKTFADALLSIYYKNTDANSHISELRADAPGLFHRHLVDLYMTIVNLPLVMKNIPDFKDLNLDLGMEMLEEFFNYLDMPIVKDNFEYPITTNVIIKLVSHPHNASFPVISERSIKLCERFLSQVGAEDVTYRYDILLRKAELEGFVKNYNDSANTYETIIREDLVDIDGDTYLAYALACFSMQDFATALENFNLAASFDDEEPLGLEAIIKNAQCLIQLQAYGDAKPILDNVVTGIESLVKSEDEALDAAQIKESLSSLIYAKFYLSLVRFQQNEITHNDFKDALNFFLDHDLSLEDLLFLGRPVLQLGLVDDIYKFKHKFNSVIAQLQIEAKNTDLSIAQCAQNTIVKLAPAIYQMQRDVAKAILGTSSYNARLFNENSDNKNLVTIKTQNPANRW